MLLSDLVCERLRTSQRNSCFPKLTQRKKEGRKLNKCFLLGTVVVSVLPGYCIKNDNLRARKC